MRSPRLLGAAAVVLLLPLVGCASTQSAGDWPGYESWDEVVAASDLVVVADLISEHESTLSADDHPGDDSYAVPVTIATVEVIDVVAGEARVGDQIDVSLPGTRSLPAAEVRYLGDIEADAVLLALVAFDGHPHSPVNPVQGVLAVDADGTVRGSDGDPGFALPSLDRLKG